MRVAALSGVIWLVGCQAVEVEYKAPPDPAKPSSAAEVRQLAAEGYEFVAPTKTILVVAPADLLDSSQKKQTPSSTADQSPSGGQAKPAVAPPPAALASAPKSSANRKGAATSAQSGSSASSPASSASATPSVAANATADATDTAAAPLATAQISDKTWMAVAAPAPDYENSFFVRGVSSFWKATTLAIARYPNSDRVSSISSTAENYVPKRIQEATSIATAVIGAVGSAVSTQSDDLQPFKLELPSQSVLDPPADLQKGWAYTLEYQEPVQLPGTVSRDAVLADSGKVGYWPVPACQVVKLTLIHGKKKNEFFVTVAAPGRYRLQPLPVAGKLTVGSTCGGSVSGTTTADPLGAISDDVTAVEQAVQKLKTPAKPPVTATQAATKPKMP